MAIGEAIFPMTQKGKAIHSELYDYQRQNNWHITENDSRFHNK